VWGRAEIPSSTERGEKKGSHVPGNKKTAGNAKMDSRGGDHGTGGGGGRQRGGGVFVQNEGDHGKEGKKKIGDTARRRTWGAD